MWGSQALHGVEGFAREIPGVGGWFRVGGGRARSPGASGGHRWRVGGLGGNPLPGFGAGCWMSGSQALHGVESFAREIPGVGGLLPGGGGAAAPPHAKRAGHRGASHHGAAQHASAHQDRRASHASRPGHTTAKARPGHGSASPSGEGCERARMFESMHQKARLMQFEAGALDTAATVGTGISNFAHEIPFVNELL